ncbi:MAG: metalloregulator ArsR/SmtB family transcription factor [Chloroflexota bacterium]|nr:metalloregulator ArsR/SmtB family transcription factor [Chloroflexota bacterium]
MGELIAGRPALRVNTAVSLPLDMVSVMSLLYRAVPGSGLDPWLVSTRRAMPGQLQHDLDLLHGFSGRLLYFMEEPIMRFDPLREDRLDATIDDLLHFLDTVPPADYGVMIESALARVHQDLGTGLAAPTGMDEHAWRRYIEPGLTTAGGEEVLRLVVDSDELKRRTIRLIKGVWDAAYRSEYERLRPRMEEAGRVARSFAGKGLTTAFGELTGNRVPSTLAAGLNKAARVTFVPSMHLGTFMSFVIYPPDVIIFFSAENVLLGGAEFAPVAIDVAANGHSREALVEGLDDHALLESLRALGDANRLRIMDLLGSGELYAQEIVGRLGIAQSAVSRHLSQLERAGLVVVHPRGGMKYYAIDSERLDAVAGSLRRRASESALAAETFVAT